jgi:hypothetical protein
VAGYKKFLFGGAESLRRVRRTAILDRLDNSKRHLRQCLAQVSADQALFGAALNDYLVGLKNLHTEI